MTRSQTQHTAQTTRQRAMLWCALLGAIGGHRFYLGQKGMGALYLAFSWTLVPLLASWIDLAILATQDDEDFAEERRESPLMHPLVYEGKILASKRSAQPSDFQRNRTA